MQIGNLKLKTDRPGESQAGPAGPERDREQAIDWMTILLSGSRIFGRALGEDATVEAYLKTLTASFICTACEIRHDREGAACQAAEAVTVASQFALLAIVGKIADDRRALRRVLAAIGDNPDLVDAASIDKVLAETGSDVIPESFGGDDPDTYLDDALRMIHSMAEAVAVHGLRTSGTQ